MISKRKKKDDIILELKDDLSLLKDYKFYFPNFLFSLWEKPKIMAFILLNADKSDIKNYLAPFIMNNFYENILSQNFIEKNLIYVLTILLNNEINNLSSIEENVNFLNDSHCGYLLEELRRKKDIQTFFKNVIIDSITELEINFSKNKLNFNIKDIYANCLEEKKNKSKFDDKDKYYYESKKFLTEQSNFNRKYMPLLNKNSLDKLIKDNNFDNSNESLYNSYKSKMENLSEDKLLYSNQKFLLHINKYNISSNILLKYQINFIEVTKFINLILDNIINNLHSLPYSIRVFCKIISLIVSKKFPKINELEKTIFLTKFFFGKLLIPILRNPGVEAYINSIILSENTINNIQIICEIINKFVTGELYSSNNKKTCDYTPFNWYFIEKSEQIHKILTTKVKLPTFIQNFINNTLSSNFEYDYFQQNKNEVINYRSICFNIHEIKALIKTIDKMKSEIFKFPGTDVLNKTFNKMSSKNYIKLIDEITEKEINSEIKNNEIDKEGNNSKEKQTIFYFLITSLITNDEYKKLFEISQPSKSFKIKELDDLSNENDIKQNNIIKVKNFICSLLYNFDKLIESNFEIDSIENTEKIFQHLNILMKSPYFVMNNEIPFDWYINSIFEYLQKIPENLTKNDCEELYKEIENDIKNSLLQLDFIKLSVILEKLDFAERGKIFYEENQKLLIDIRLKESAKVISQEEFIPVIIKFNWNDEENNGLFQIESCNFEEKDKNNNKKITDFEYSKQAMLALTIDMFIEKFPDLIRYEEYQDIDIFMIQEKLKFGENLSKYFDIIFEHIQLKNNFRIDGQNMIRLRKNIFDYVMIKLFDKIFPAGSSERDNILFQKCVCLSWVKPQNLLGDKKQYVYGSYLADLKINFKQLQSEKSTRKKIKNMNKIFNDISYFYEFNGIKNISVDDIIPILAYGIIKVQPFFLVSNNIKIYHNLCDFFSEGNVYEQLNATIELIINMNYTNLKGVTKDEFVKNMKTPKI